MDALAKKVEEDEAMLRRMKQDLATRLRAGEEAPAAELEKIVKLEVRLANLAMVVEAREITAET